MSVLPVPDNGTILPVMGKMPGITEHFPAGILKE